MGTNLLYHTTIFDRINNILSILELLICFSRYLSLFQLRNYIEFCKINGFLDLLKLFCPQLNRITKDITHIKFIICWQGRYSTLCKYQWLRPLPIGILIIQSLISWNDSILHTIYNKRYFCKIHKRVILYWEGSG